MLRSLHSFPTRRSSDLTLSIAGPALAKDLGLDAVTMGYVFSAFGWSYVIGQLPGGWLLDRFGSKLVYFGSIDRKSTRLNSSHPSTSYAVFCLKKKTKIS